MDTMKSIEELARQALEKLEQVDTTDLAAAKLYKESTLVGEARLALDRLIALLDHV